MPDVHNYYEKFLNKKIREYKENGIKSVSGTNLRVDTIKDDRAAYPRIDFYSKCKVGDEYQWIPAPQDAVASLKSEYNYVRKNNPDLSDSAIMSAVVSKIFFRIRELYLDEVGRKDEVGHRDTYVIGLYYSLSVLRGILIETEADVEKLSCADQIDDFLRAELQRVGASQKRDAKWETRVNKLIQIEKLDDSVEGGGEAAKFFGGILGIGLAIFFVYGAIKLVSQGDSHSSSGGKSPYGGYEANVDIKDELRDAANSLYDKCQSYGSSYDGRCN